MLEEGIRFEEKGNTIEAFSAYKQKMNLAEKQFCLSKLFNTLTWQYFQNNQNLEKALRLSQMVNELSPYKINVNAIVPGVYGHR